MMLQVKIKSIIFLSFFQLFYLEFVPYVLQILGFLVESHPTGSTSLPYAYRTLFQYILTPAFWDRSGNIPALSRLLQAYAEEHAIQYLLYHLADGLRKESIGLDTYLKVCFSFYYYLFFNKYVFCSMLENFLVNNLC